MIKTLLFLLTALATYSTGQNAPQNIHETPGRSELLGLREIGMQIIGAVMTQDTETLLKFDRPDLRSEDARALADPRSWLSCFLFNEQCIQKGSRTVRRSLVAPRKLGIAVQMPQKQRTATVYAGIVFYDASGGEIAEEKLCSSGFVRETWTFKWTTSGWVSARPMFDSETEGWCGEN